MYSLYNNAHPFKTRYLEPYPQNVYIDRYAHQRDVLAARAQRTQPKLREFWARACTAIQCPSALQQCTSSLQVAS